MKLGKEISIMRIQFQEVLEHAARREPTSITFEAGGTTYIRNFCPQERLVLLGGGHIACPLCQYSADLGFAVTVADDRPSFANHQRFPEAQTVICDTFSKALHSIQVNESDYAAVITRGHRHDADCLRVILSGPFPRYLGMIGSKRRVMGLFNLLEQEGFSRSILNQIHAPIGLPINALTPKEIAVSILAELIQTRREKRSGHRLENVLDAEDVDLPLLECLADKEKSKVLLLVCETHGSTPVKSGAMMAVTQDFQTSGTIGGGCSEHSVLMEAYRLIGSGERRCITVDMSGDVAEDEGMVCGGQMKVLIADVGRSASC